MSYLSFKKIIRFVAYISIAFIISIVFTNLVNAQYFGYSPYMYGGSLMQPYGMYGAGYGYGNPYGYGGYGMYSGYGMYGTGYGGYGMYSGYGMYGTGYNYPYSYSGYYGGYSGISGFTTATAYVDADVELDSGDDGDEITVDEGDTMSITLSAYHNYGYYYVLDDDDLDDDVVDFDSAYYLSTYSTEQWIFEAEEPGTTTITLEYTSTSGTANTLEFEITVE